MGDRLPGCLNDQKRGHKNGVSLRARRFAVPEAQLLEDR